MKVYRNMPRELVDGWATSIVSHAGGQPFDFHYHEVEEWLEVLEGDICFVSAGGVEYPLFQNQALNIPQGEVHQVRVGPNGVKYNMWLSAEVSDEDFSKKLDDQDLSLIKKNLEVLKAEDSEDREFYRAFFDDFLFEEFTFRGADRKLLNKRAFLERAPANFTRIESDSIRILHESPGIVLLSTVVHTQPKAGGARSSFTNFRLFVTEEGIGRCRVWINYPEPGD